MESWSQVQWIFRYSQSTNTGTWNLQRPSAKQKGDKKQEPKFYWNEKERFRGIPAKDTGILEKNNAQDSSRFFTF